MKIILEINHVILVLLVIFCVTNTVENRPNGNGLFSIRTRHRRSKEDVTSTTKWSRRSPAEERLSFQRYLIRELFSKDTDNNDNGKVSNSRTKKWLRRKLRRLERKYLKNKFQGYRKSWRMRRRRKESQGKKWSKKNGHGKAIGLKEFLSFSQRQSLNYEHIVTLQSQQLKESNVDYLTNPDHQPIVAFDVSTLSHRMTSEADHAKLIVYLSEGNNNNDINTDDDQNAQWMQTKSCNCDIIIRERLSTPKMIKIEEPIAVTISQTSIKNNAWNSFDISAVLNTSTVFNENDNDNNNNDHNNDNNQHDYTINNTPPLLHLSFQYKNCLFQDYGDPSQTNHNIGDSDTRSGENRCHPDLQIGSNDDKIPLLVLFSEKQNNADDTNSEETSLDTYLDTDYSNSISNNQENLFPSSFQHRFDPDNTNKQHPQNTLGSPSTSNTFPTFSESHAINEKDNSLEFQHPENASTSATSWMPTSRIKRSKRRARRNRGGRNSCRRKEMYVDFTKMRWADFIAYPKGYPAYQCVGRCYSPISKYLTPTTHAVIQNLVHAKNPRKASRVCCVPTKLTPISMLLYDKNMNVENRELKDMVVTECGCR